MLSEFERKVADFLKANELFGDVSKMLLAVSGGADSMALLYMMQALKEHDVLRADLHCVHINHLLRSDQAEKDEDFVITQATKLQLGVTTRRIHVREFARENKLSIETAARKLRMKNLIDIARANQCSQIITGHQKDDNAETVVHRLLRGTGFRGLAGIWPARTFDNGIRFVRPLLCVTRDEILKYLCEKNLKWQEDLTNLDCRYTRNYIRHQLLPVLRQDFNGSLVEQLFELSESAQRFHKNVCIKTGEIWPKITEGKDKKIILNLELFSRQSQPVKVELIRRSLAHIGCGEVNMTQQHYQNILQLAERNVTGRTIELPGGFIVRREYHDLIFSNRRVGLGSATGAPPKSCQQDKAEPVTVKIPGKTQFGQYFIEAKILEANEKYKATKTNFIEHFDLDKIKLPLVVRFRKSGDRFVPLGQRGEQRIGKFLTAQKVPTDLRQKVLVVTNSENIIWLWPIRISEQAKITNKTRKIIKLRISNIKPAD